MIYPRFLTDGSTIGIPAPSAGIPPKKEPSFDISLENIRKNGYKIQECDGIRNENYPSDSAEKRARDVNNLIKNDDIGIILCATGGDFLVEILPCIDYDAVAKNPKWIQGYSDPTSLLYSITTLCDVATIYGGNAGSFDMNNLHESLKNNLEIWRGNIVKQNSFDKYESTRNDEVDGYNLDAKVEWKAINGDFEAEGRLLGGCFECINDILGTRFDGTKAFIERYKDDGIIWYFDVFAMSAEVVANTLWKMKQMGYFENAKAFIFGRVMFPNEYTITYENAIKRVLGTENVVINADVGHVNPKMTLINGAYGKVVCKDGRGSLEMELK
ncbi:MAG: LD-carboxypeptidase [Clostridia bacterium]|nr:LD-carboxypeptidase [Clostridia bacterium]MBR5265810.1 LD-carboxypeptidase [Clostridia bacterium]